LTAGDAERMLTRAGYVLLRVKGSHHIFSKGTRRVIVPFHASAVLHPKIVRQVLDAIEGE
jgi:predicted RNA binding protein YcfA (HicA-like mRNA interferase family)